MCYVSKEKHTKELFRFDLIDEIFLILTFHDTGIVKTFTISLSIIIFRRLQL